MAGSQIPEMLQRGVSIFIFVLGIGMVAVHTSLVALAAPLSALANRKRVLSAVLVCAYLTVWLGIAITTGDRINFPLSREDLRLPVSLLVGFGPMFLGIALLFASRTMREINAAMPTTWLIRAQMYRMGGLIFLYPFLYYGLIPAVFAVPAALGDFATGAFAALVASAVARRRPHAIGWAVAWNLFGILDLIVAPTAAVLSRARLIGLYPLSLVALFIGPPLGILMHVYSLRNLAVNSSTSSRAAPGHPSP